MWKRVSGKKLGGGPNCDLAFLPPHDAWCQVWDQRDFWFHPRMGTDSSLIITQEKGKGATKILYVGCPSSCGTGLSQHFDSIVSLTIIAGFIPCSLCTHVESSHSTQL